MALPPDGPGHSPAPPPLGAQVPDAANRYLAEARADDAIDERIRLGWARQAAAESLTLAGLWAAWCAVGGVVVVMTTAGRRHTGEPVEQGRDFVALRTGTGRLVLVRADAVAWVTSERNVDRTLEPAATAPTLAERLAELAWHRPGVQIWSGRDVVARGTLEAVGVDVAVVAASHGRLVVPLYSVTEVLEPDSG